MRRVLDISRPDVLFGICWGGALLLSSAVPVALSVEARARLRGTGQALLEALSIEFKNAGVSKMRTMVARDNRLHLLFFRSAGMMAGPYIQLEKELD